MFTILEMCEIFYSDFSDREKLLKKYNLSNEEFLKVKYGKCPE